MFSSRNMMFCGSFNPLSLLPALWLDGSDAATRFDSVSGGSLVTTNGASVARLEDKSGNARHATQATPTSRPTLVTSAQNGRDALNFDGINDCLTSVAFGGSETWTRWVVFVSLASQYKTIIAHATSYISPISGADYMSTNAQRLEVEQSGLGGITTKVATATNTPTGTYVLASQVCDGTNSGNTPRINGATFALSNTLTSNPGTFTKAATAYGIGAYNDGTFPCNCRISEVFHVPGVVSAENRQATDRFFMNKWGIV